MEIYKVDVKKNGSSTYMVKYFTSSKEVEFYNYLCKSSLSSKLSHTENQLLRVPVVKIRVLILGHILDLAKISE